MPYIAIIDTDPMIQKYYEKHICNKCGEECSSIEADKDITIPTFYGLLDAKVVGSYYSPVLGDCTSYKFDICEKCLKELFNDFVIPVEESDESPWGGGPSYG